MWGEGLSPRVSLIISGLLQRPEVRGHGLQAARLVLLSQEGRFVRIDLAQIFLTRSDRLRYLSEAGTSPQFVCGRRSGAFVGIRFADVEARTVGVGSGRFTVSSDEVIAVVMAIDLFGFREGTLDILDTRRVGYFSQC